MSDTHTEELISAYLDGELSSEERAQVELMLDQEPAWRQELEV